jgi:hypothetical protein
VHVNKAIWRDIAPYLIEMSKMEEMQQMENLLLEAGVQHGELHSDVGNYDESLSALIWQEEKILSEASKIISKERAVIEHGALHTDNGPYDE